MHTPYGTLLDAHIYLLTKLFLNFAWILVQFFFLLESWFKKESFKQGQIQDLTDRGRRSEAGCSRWCKPMGGVWQHHENFHSYAFSGHRFLDVFNPFF